MAIDIWSLPRDPSSGNVVGSYRLRHDTELNGTIGIAAFENGLSVRAFSGRELLMLAAAIGAYLTLVPDDDAARAALGLQAQPAEDPLPATETVPASATEQPSTDELRAEQAPAADEEAEPAKDDLDAIEDIEALRSIAASLGIDDAVRWQHKRVRAAIRKARAEQAPAV